jgi:FMN reductase
LERALDAAKQAGATTELFALNDLRLPMYEPDLPLDAYGSEAIRFVDAVRHADALIWSTAAYHGSLAAPTKNALDFLEFLGNDEHPYLDQRVVGLIATAAGEIAAVNSVNTMIHVAHALRAMVVPLVVTVPQAAKVFDADGRVTSEKIARRLDQLGRLVAETAMRFQSADVADAAL